jgi:hypothetical protein
MSVIALSTSKVRWLEKGARNCVVLATLRTYVNTYVRTHIGTWLPRPDPGFLCIKGGPISLPTQHCGEILFVFNKIKFKSMLDNILVYLMPSLVW